MTGQHADAAVADVGSQGSANSGSITSVISSLKLGLTGRSTVVDSLIELTNDVDIRVFV